jgi:hypothetical protein
VTEPQITEIPPTPAEAAATLAARLGDKAWAAQFLNGSEPQVAEYRRLSEIAIKSDDKVSLAMAGQYLPINDSEHLTRMGAASMLREAGIEPDVIKQTLSGGPVSQQEYDAAVKLKAKLMGNSEFTRKYLAGEGEAVQQMTLLQIITSSEVRQEAKS